MHTHGFCGVPTIPMDVPVLLPLWVQCSWVWVWVWEKKPKVYLCHTLSLTGVNRLKFVQGLSMTYSSDSWQLSDV